MKIDNLRRYNSFWDFDNNYRPISFNKIKSKILSNNKKYKV